MHHKPQNAAEKYDRQHQYQNHGGIHESSFQELQAHFFDRVQALSAE
jgi:hypothetical protein